MTVILWDGGSVGQAHADGANHHALFGGFAGSLFGVVLMVFAVGDDDDGATLVALPGLFSVAQRLHGFLDGVADGGALCADHAAVYLFQKETCGTIVVGEWHLDVAAAGKDDERHAVAGHVLEQTAHHTFGTLQSVGLDVLSHHAVGDVQTDGHIAADAFPFDTLAAHLRIGGSHDKQCQRQHQQAVFDGAAPARDVGHQATEHGTVGKAVQSTLFGQPHHDAERDEQHYDNQ